ncbi:unnamed protein product [Pleuronectes platessa]|uniref:Uncharacterized protein n=1 Tax=Pleuronectes platessa TaxID=8262 RepID=A0A9N7VXG7_PLEPL|nr:unnamed protein product [Pleuronectes platessa]
MKEKLLLVMCHCHQSNPSINYSTVRLRSLFSSSSSSSSSCLRRWGSIVWLRSVPDSSSIRVSGVRTGYRASVSVGIRVHTAAWSAPDPGTKPGRPQPFSPRLISYLFGYLERGLTMSVREKGILTKDSVSLLPCFYFVEDSAAMMDVK